MPFTVNHMLATEWTSVVCGLPEFSGVLLLPDLSTSHWFWAAGGGGFSMFGRLFAGADGAEVGFCTCPVVWVGLGSAIGEAGRFRLPARESVFI